MKRTYAELQVLLADNVTRDISPEDLRDFLDSVATERANIFDIGLVQPHTTSDIAYVKPTLVVTEDIKDSFIINPDGTVTLTKDGVYSLIFYFRVDLRATGTLSTGNQLFLQLFDTDSGLANSVEASIASTNKSQYGSIRLQSEHERAGTDITIEPRFASTLNNGQIVVNEVYISVNSIPVIKT